jgi:hypothetical protein
MIGIIGAIQAIVFFVFVFNFPPALALSQAFVCVWCQLALIYQGLLVRLASSSKAFIHWRFVFLP